MRGYWRPARALRPGDRGARISSSDNGAPSAWSEVEVRNWHNPVAPATGQPVRLRGYFDLSLVFCVSQPSSGNGSV